VAGLEEAFERIGAAAEHHLPRTNAPGLSLAVTDADDTLGAVVRGFADVAAGRPVLPDTRFQIGSIGKSFAALCVLQEAAKGTLSLDVSINEVLPWLELPEPFGPIALHHLLTHSSGLMAGNIEAGWGMIDAVRARSHPPSWAPGQRFWYSNLGYTLVGLALERASRTPVHRLLMERILGPLGMTRSVGAILEDDRPDAAVGYEPIDADRVPHLQTPLGPAVWQPSTTADGSIVSTAPDLCAYARMVLARGGDLLEEASFARWIGPYVDSGERGERYGYGWDVLDRDGRRVLRHTGGTVGFSALLELWPDDGLAVAICQNGSGDQGPLAAFALGTVAAAVRGDEPPAEPSWAAPAAAELAGTYVGTERSLRIELAGGEVMIHAGPLAVPLERIWSDPDELVVPHPALDRYPLRVVREPGGTVAGLAHGPAWFPAEGRAEPDPADHPPAWEAFTGLYRTDSPWTRAYRVYLRRGRLYLLLPVGGDEQELLPLDDGAFAVRDPELPMRVRFTEPVEGQAQTLEFNGMRLTRSFEA